MASAAGYRGLFSTTDEPHLFLHPDLAEQPPPHIAGASDRQMWEWFRPVADGADVDRRCSTIVLRPFENEV